MKIWYIDDECESFDNSLLERLATSLDGKQNWTSFEERNLLETDFTKRQIIPYIVIVDPSDEYKIFSYQRTKLSGETRLHGNYSIGVGGHVDLITGNFRKDLQLNIEKELKEELGYTSFPLSENELYPHCFLILSENEVDKVHLGVVYILKLPKEAMQYWRGELGLTMVNYAFRTKEELEKLNLETWSKVLLERLTN